MVANSRTVWDQHTYSKPCQYNTHESFSLIIAAFPYVATSAHSENGGMSSYKSPNFKQLLVVQFSYSCYAAHMILEKYILMC